MSSEFIPVITNTQEVQWRPSPAQKFFLASLQRLREAGLPPALARQLDETQDSQGFYILGPDGTPYGWNNDADPEDILHFMNVSLPKWREHPPAAVKISDAEIAAPWTTTPAPEVQVMRVYARIRPLPERIWGLNRSVGRDYLWTVTTHHGDDRQYCAASLPTAPAQPGRRPL